MRAMYRTGYENKFFIAIPKNRKWKYRKWSHLRKCSRKVWFGSILAPSVRKIRSLIYWPMAQLIYKYNRFFLSRFSTDFLNYFSSIMIFSALLLLSGDVLGASVSKDIFALTRAGRECNSDASKKLCEDGCLTAYENCENKCSDETIPVCSECYRAAFECIDCECDGCTSSDNLTICKFVLFRVSMPRQMSKWMLRVWSLVLRKPYNPHSKYPKWPHTDSYGYAW